MSELFRLTGARMPRLQPFFPSSRGKPRDDDRHVPGRITFINNNGLRWPDTPKECGPSTSLHDRWKRLLSGMHPRPKALRHRSHVQQAQLLTPEPHRDHVRPAKRLTARGRRCDECQNVFFSAIARGGGVIFCLRESITLEPTAHLQTQSLRGTARNSDSVPSIIDNFGAPFLSRTIHLPLRKPTILNPFLVLQ